MNSPGTSANVIDPAAATLLKLAIEAEQAQRYLTARDLYNEGIKRLLDSVRNISDSKLRTTLMDRVRQYVERAEALRRIIELEKKKPHGYHEQVIIQENATGYGLEKVFGPYLDEQLTEVEIDDAYIRYNHQIQLFLKFCAVLIKNSTNLKRIRLKTSGDPDPVKRSVQVKRLDEVRVGLLHRGIVLFIEYSETLHDREIRLNNGWIIKIGRGLDYFKRADPNTIEFFELDFRPCMATTIDIIYTPSSVPTPSPSTSGLPSKPRK